MKVVWITWLGSLVGTGWIHAGDIPLEDVEAPKICSIGFLYKETEHSYFLVSNRLRSEDNEQVNGYISIPKCSVIEMFILNRGDDISNINIDLNS